MLRKVYYYFKEIINSEATSSDLLIILKLMWKSLLTVEQLKEIKIGKLVNLVKGEERFDKEVRRIALALVNRWKEMVQVYKRAAMTQPSNTLVNNKHNELSSFT